MNILHEGKFLRLVERNGWEYVERTNCSDIAIIIPITTDDKVIFVEQYRPPVDSQVIEFPAGLVGDKRKENFNDAVCRELEEETGYKTKEIINLINGPVSSGSSSDIQTFVLTPNITKTGIVANDEDENIIVHEVPFPEISLFIKRMKKENKIISPRIYIGLYFLNQYRNGSLS